MGVPTITIITQAFESLARAGASAAGVPDLPVHILPRPVGAMSPEEVRAFADQQVDQLVADLTRGDLTPQLPSLAGKGELRANA